MTRVQLPRSDGWSQSDHGVLQALRKSSRPWTAACRAMRPRSPRQEQRRRGSSDPPRDGPDTPDCSCLNIQSENSPALRSDSQLVTLQRHRGNVLVTHALCPKEWDVPTLENRFRPQFPPIPGILSLDVSKATFVIWHNVANPFMDDWLHARRRSVLRQ